MHYKLLEINDINVKFDGEKDGVFSGYASVFGGVDAYGDTIIPGAYKATLENRKRPVQMRWNHYGDVIGKWMDMEEDEKGLFVRGQLTPGHSKAQDVYASLKHGAISGLSIGYRPVKYAENETGGLNLMEIDLVEISVVESPADLAAQIDTIKSDIEGFTRLKDMESYLREVGGFSRDAATMLVSRMKSLIHGEREAEEKRQQAEILQVLQEKANFYRNLGDSNGKHRN
jgi:HK97 family phage prohead protease